MYDPSKEKDKEVLQEYTRHLSDELIDARREIFQLKKQKAEDEQLQQKLTEELLNLRKRVFDSKQERKLSIPKKKRKSGKLPHNQSPNIPINEVPITLEEENIPYHIENQCCPHCGEFSLKEMNNCFEESSEIDVIERRYFLKRHQRQKYSCKSCHKVATAPGGVKLTPGGEYSIDLATQIASDKFEDHIPLERQRKQMKRAGLNVEVKTLFGLTEHLYRRLGPMNELIRKDVLSEKWVHIDESPIDFYNPQKSKGYIWSMSNPRGAYYQFEPTRSGAVAREMMKGFESGCIVTDGYSGYNFLDSQENIKHACCWAHVRRKFFEAMNHDPKAERMVDLIDNLYELEHQALNLAELKRIRQEKSSGIVEEIEHWIDSMDSRYLESSSIGKAIKYYLERRKGLHYFLTDELVPIDNNMAERRQRCPVMGRKNFVHFKSINGADVGAFFYSVIESCKSNGLNARTFINEMARRSARGEDLESPFNYAKRLNSEISSRLSQELSELLKKSESS
jgi:transposase